MHFFRIMLALSIALLSCGPSTPPANPVAEPAPSASAAQPQQQPDLPDRSVHIAPSKLVDDARKIGIDFKVPFESIPTPQKKQLMPLFVKALGYEGCTGCHVDGEWERETRNIKIAREMWDHFVVAMRDDKGGALFCDTCHGGRAKSLDRQNMDAVQKLMETDYQAKLTRADKHPHDCTTCHGTKPELEIIEKLWGIAAK